VALGAAPRHVIAVIVRGAMAPLAIGLGISAVAALFLSRLLVTLLYQVQADDPFTYLVAAALLLTIGACASVVPAWRAATGDPIEALRSD